MKYCALCCIAKDEDLFLKEWLAYHARIGFEHFIIYDDLSANPIADFLDGWLNPGDVTIIRNDKHLSQDLAYSHCLERFGRQFLWIAFLDLDEFIRLSPDALGGSMDIRLFLAEFEPYAALGVNWRTFSWSGHETTPSGPVIGSYTHCLGDDIHIKSIVQPAKIARCAGAHSFYVKEGEFAVNAERFPIPSGFPFTVPATGRIAVNHYYYKSRECFAAKIARGNPCLIDRRMDEFDRHTALSCTVDDALVPLAEDISRRIAGQRLLPPPSHRFLSSEQLEGYGTDSLGNARAYLRREGDREALRQAMLHLCHVAYLNGVDGNPDPLLSLDIWTLRAQAARLWGDLPLARHCLTQAFRFGASQQAHAEMAALLLAEGNAARARQALDIIKAFGK